MHPMESGWGGNVHGQADGRNNAASLFTTSRVSATTPLSCASIRKNPFSLSCTIMPAFLSLFLFLHSRPQGSRIHSFAVDTLRTVPGARCFAATLATSTNRLPSSINLHAVAKHLEFDPDPHSAPGRSSRPVSRRLIFFLAGRSGVEFDDGERHGSQDEGEAGPTRGRKRNFPIAARIEQRRRTIRW